MNSPIHGTRNAPYQAPSVTPEIALGLLKEKDPAARKGGLSILIKSTQNLTESQISLISAHALMDNSVEVRIAAVQVLELIWKSSKLAEQVILASRSSPEPKLCLAAADALRDSELQKPLELSLDQLDRLAKGDYNGDFVPIGTAVLSSLISGDESRRALARKALPFCKFPGIFIYETLNVIATDPNVSALGRMESLELMAVVVETEQDQALAKRLAEHSWQHLKNRLKPDPQGPMLALAPGIEEVWHRALTVCSGEERKDQIVELCHLTERLNSEDKLLGLLEISELGSPDQELATLLKGMVSREQDRTAKLLSIAALIAVSGEHSKHVGSVRQMLEREYAVPGEDLYSLLSSQMKSRIFQAIIRLFFDPRIYGAVALPPQSSGILLGECISSPDKVTQFGFAELLKSAVNSGIVTFSSIPAVLIDTFRNREVIGQEDLLFSCHSPKEQEQVVIAARTAATIEARAQAWCAIQSVEEAVNVFRDLPLEPPILIERLGLTALRLLLSKDRSRAFYIVQELAFRHGFYDTPKDLALTDLCCIIAPELLAQVQARPTIAECNNLKNLFSIFTRHFDERVRKVGYSGIDELQQASMPLLGFEAVPVEIDPKTVLEQYPMPTYSPNASERWLRHRRATGQDKFHPFDTFVAETGFSALVNSGRMTQFYAQQLLSQSEYISIVRLAYNWLQRKG